MTEDDDEDFQALFFTECDENLADLQARLDALQAGDTDPETVNAAFRAVHSVKGGAAAFGFAELVRFAHDFETVMDRVRSGALDLGPDVCPVLLRAGDVMSALVEATRAGAAGPSERIAQVKDQLAALLGPRAADQAAAPAADPQVAADLGRAETVPVIEATVRLAPGPGFLLAGFDPARIIRAAREHGLVSVQVEGALPPIGNYAHGSCPLAWRLAFEVENGLDALRSFLAPYAYQAEVTLEAEGGTEVLLPDVGRVDPQGPTDLAADRSREGEAGAPASVVPAADPFSSAPAAARTAPAAPSRTLRVDLDRVDRLVNLAGEVLIAQAALAQVAEQGSGAGDAALKPLVEALSRQARDLQESVMAIRAQPVRAVFARLPRVVRDLGDALGKEARLVLRGEDVEIDTTVVEELNEPLVHMIRNAMDHGMEMPDEREAAGKPRQGTLTLTAEQRGGRVRITLADDGRGIDRVRVLAKARERGLVPDEPLDDAGIDELIFHPGFSTAEQISSVSGRGVGMDVVRRKIQSMSGRCVVASLPGRGTTFTITLPLTLAVMDGMAVQVDEQQFILPLSNVVEALSVDPARVARLSDRSRVFRMKEGFLPLYSLRAALALPERLTGEGTALVIDTEGAGHVVVLVDDLLGQRQVVLKSLEQNVGAIDGVGGATILGDGRVALVLDVPTLFRLGARGAGGDLERMH